MPGVCETTGGTVAGNALAGVMYALADATIERKLLKRLVAAGLAVHFPYTASEDAAWDASPHFIANGITCRRIAYVDDGVVPVFRGPGSSKAKRQLMVVQQGIIKCSSSRGDFELLAVNKYKHLGAWNFMSGTMTPELIYRGALGTEAIGPIRTKFFKHPEIEDVCRW